MEKPLMAKKTFGRVCLISEPGPTQNINDICIYVKQNLCIEGLVKILYIRNRVCPVCVLFGLIQDAPTTFNL